MKTATLFLLICFIQIGVVRAQEICDDGIDNDGDGFIDCYDSDCSNSSDCDGFFLGNDASCEAMPSEFPNFSLTLDFASPNETANHLGRIAIGDLDRDGIPEIVSQNKYTGKLFVLNGDDGTVKYSTVVKDASPDWRIAIANVDNDDCAEIFSVISDKDYYYVAAYDCELNELWRSEEMDKDPVHLSLADFDGDGLVELFYKDEIRDAKTGTRIVKNSGVNWNGVNGGPVAVDIIGDEDLELISGGTIYEVNLGSRAANAGSLTELRKIPDYKTKTAVSSTSVADYNLDGFLDVIATGAVQDGTTTVFFWDVENDVIKTFSDPIPSVSSSTLKCSSQAPDKDDYAKGWKNGTGRLNIGDLDGDGQLNVSFVSGRFLYALDEDFNLFWRVEVNEETSGHTGCTLFDFNGDGKTEVVYRDEQYIYIINGTDGSAYPPVRCISRTNVEYPIVADVDADGSTELCVVCGTVDSLAWDKFCNLGYSRNSQVRIYKSATEPWVPARRLWNQHGYFNVNVNDDLSIPTRQQKHHLIWSEGNCTVGPNRPLNGFLNQSPFLNSQGCPTYAAPDIAFTGDIVVDQPSCPDLDFTVSFQITNLGDIAISGDIPVSYYSGNPLQPGAVKLATMPITVNNLDNGDVVAVDNIPITGAPGMDSLFIALNDSGSSIPTPISFPNTGIIECDYDNIRHALIDPLPFALSVESTDDVRCAGSTAPPNGSARAFRLIGVDEVTADYNFYWFNGPTATGTPDFEGAVYAGLAAGTYSVYAMHKTAFCNSDTVQVVVGTGAKAITVEIEEDQPNDNCKNPNGKLRAIVNGGEPTGNFTYEWLEGDITSTEVVSTSHVASDLKGGVNYTVIVTDKTTGCSNLNSMPVTDNSMAPVVSATPTDITCSSTNSGILEASVGGATSGYTFNWYEGNTVRPTPQYTGSVVNNLSAGNYIVVAINNSTNCESLPFPVTIDQTLPPKVQANKVTNNTSCDDNTPNGSASASASNGGGDYTFEWFNALNQSIGTGNTIDGLAKGTYTVRVTDANECTDTDQVVILNKRVMPDLTVTPTDVTQCNPFDGTITTTVSSGSVSDYTFFYYNGSSVKDTPDYAETGNVLTDLPAGVYTVEAQNNITTCMSSSAKTVKINAPVIEIELDGAASSYPADCNTNSGVLTVNILPSTANYSIAWYVGNVDPATATPFLTESGSSSTASALTSGNYTVLATNLVTGCEETGVFNMPLVTGHELELTAVGSATTCSDNNGSIVVELTKTNLAGYDESDYEIRLFEGSTTSGAALQVETGIAGQTGYTFSGLPSGSYAITAIALDPVIEVCEDPVVLTKVDLVIEYPQVQASTLNANTNCSGITANGLIEIEVNGGTSPLSEFNITWFEGQDTSNPLNPVNISGADNEIAQDLIPGYYTVSVTDATNYLTCNTTKTFRILDEPPVIYITEADLDITNMMSCDPVNNGSVVTITQIMEDETAGNLANYTFEWLDSDNNPLAATDSQITNVAPGSYTVRATNMVNNCLSAIIAFEIEDETMGDPAVDLVGFNNPTKCLLPVNEEGMLQALASGSASGYTYLWTDNSGTPLPVGNISGANGEMANGLTVGTYNLRVTNNDTQCFIEDSYELTLDEKPVTITASATPLTSCIMDDGSAFATVTSGESDQYNYNWSNGDTGKEVPGLPAGDYTVQAVSQVDSDCESPEVTVTIAPEQIMPAVMVEAIAPMSVCDELLANGTANATVDGGYIGYTFNWYEGASVSGAPVYTGSEYSKMKAGAYTVEAVNNITGCSASESIDIKEDIIEGPPVSIDLLSHDTSCSYDNGALSASVNGNVSDYIFNWYDGNTVSGTPDFTGEIYDSLSAGFYTVVATSKITGCISQATEEILEMLNFPEFTFVAGNSSCGENNGFIRLIMSNEVGIKKIIWTFKGDDPEQDSIGVGPILSNVGVGEYTAHVYTMNDCYQSEDVDVKTDINTFNGISRNGDSKNEIFKIECIEEFPDNIVKIFNRAGTQVFEVEGYNNEDKSFDGVSNKGIAIMGNNLPDGTYFYIIDKRDGSKPNAGYLEIVN